MTFPLLSLAEARVSLADSEGRLRQVQDAMCVVDPDAHHALQVRIMRTVLRLREQVRTMSQMETNQGGRTDG